MIQENIDNAVNTIVNRYSGETIAYYGRYPSESFVPVAYYIELLTEASFVPDDLYNWGNSLPAELEPFFTSELFQPDTDYPRGTVLLWNTPHAAIIVEGGKDSATVFEQNADPEGSPCHTMNRSISDCAYALIPRTSEPLPIKQPMVYMTAEIDGVKYKSFGMPRKMFVSKLNGTDQLEFGGKIDTFRDFMGVPNTHKAYGEMVRVIAVAHHPVPPTGHDFYLDMDAFGQFTRTGRVTKTQGYPTSDLSNEHPGVAVSTPVVAPTLITAQPMTDITPVPDPKAWNFRWFNDDHSSVKYQVMQNRVVKDYLGRGSNNQLVRGKIVGLYGSFQVDGRTLLLLRLNDTQVFDYWYGVPEVDQRGYRIVEEYEDPSDLRLVAPTFEERQALHNLTLRDKISLLAVRLAKRKQQRSK